MKIYHKLLGVTLPIALIALVMGAYVTFHLSHEALHQIARMWLTNRLSEGISLVAEQETFLRMYGINNIQAGTRKAQYDALKRLAAVQIGEEGYVFVLDRQGKVLLHPEKRLLGISMANEPWFSRIWREKKGELIHSHEGKMHLVEFDFFQPWEWMVMVSDPYDEIYGPLNKTKTYLFTMALWSSLFISLFIILLTRYLFTPLKLLVDGAERVKKGDLDIQIPIKSGDEMGRLSRVFNAMAMALRKNMNDLKESEEQLHHLNSRLITAQENERKRVATELHDEVGQSLTVMKLKMILMEEGLTETAISEVNLHGRTPTPPDHEQKSALLSRRIREHAKMCDEMVQYIDTTIDNVRRLCRDLTPTVITDLGLAAALMWLIDHMGDHFEICAEINLDDVDDILTLDRQLLVYRMVQEALSNAARHSEATTLQLTVMQKAHQLVVMIEDNGKGFDYDSVRERHFDERGLGLATIKERARMLGATMNIITGKNAGTRLHFSIPIDMGHTHSNL